MNRMHLRRRRPPQALAAAAISLAIMGRTPAQTADVPRAALPEAVPVFRSGERGYHTFRIPAIVSPRPGTLLAFAEGRVHGAHDSGNIDIVLKRSSDGGATWSELQVIADNGDGVFGNPAPVVGGDGSINLLVVRQPAGCSEADIRAGRRGSRTPYLLRSTDGGGLWSGPEALPHCTRDAWRWYATGPCHGARVPLDPSGPQIRLVVPANHSVAGSGANSQFGAHLLLSDDDGKTWRVGAVDDHHVGNDVLNPSECTVVALGVRDLLVHTRDHHGSSEGTRAWARSRDGGTSFATPFAPLPDLAGPVCQGSLLALATEGGTWIVHSGPADPAARRSLRLRLSADSGQTWLDGPRVAAEGADAAYSDLVDLTQGSAGPGQIGCLWEAKGYREIAFTVVELPPHPR